MVPKSRATAQSVASNRAASSKNSFDPQEALNAMDFDRGSVTAISSAPLACGRIFKVRWILIALPASPPCFMANESTFAQFLVEKFFHLRRNGLTVLSHICQIIHGTSLISRSEGGSRPLLPIPKAALRRVLGIPPQVLQQSAAESSGVKRCRRTVEFLHFLAVVLRLLLRRLLELAKVFKVRFGAHQMLGLCQF